MRPDTQLDYAVFQLTANRTRCELHIAAQGTTYKLASGFLKPFIAHLGAAEEQIAAGGYSVRLEPPDPGAAVWFTKGTIERFVRFVSTPEVLEHVSAIELQLMELEETICMQISQKHDASEYASDGVEPGMEEPSKQQLLRALDARKKILQKEQGMAFARAVAAGFSMEHMDDLLLFAENFKATRLRDACSKFLAVCKKKQEPGLWQEDLKSGAAESAHADMALMAGGKDSIMSSTGPRERPDAWPDVLVRGMKVGELRRASLPSDGTLPVGDVGLEKLTRRGSLDELTGEFWQVAARMRSSGMMEGFNADSGPPSSWSSSWQLPLDGRHQEMHAPGAGYLEGPGEFQDPNLRIRPSLVRGHTSLGVWEGQLQNPYMPNMHPLYPHARMLGIPRPPYAGLPYPPYLGHSYLDQAYPEANAHQMPSRGSPPYWPGHLGYNGPTASEHPDMVPSALHDQQDYLTQSNLREAHREMPPTSTGQLDNKQLLLQAQEELPAPIDQSDSNSLQAEGTNKAIADGHVHDHDNSEKPLHQADMEPATDATRRLPVRSASPSRRSASPMRKVQIGRSGSKRSGVVIRNINYVPHNERDKDKDGNESSDSWSEDNEDRKHEIKEEPVRARVQDVIGLFESKKASNEAREKPIVRRPSSKNSVLSRWIEPGASMKDSDKTIETSDLEEKRNTSWNDVREMESKGPTLPEAESQGEKRVGQVDEEMLSTALVAEKWEPNNSIKVADDSWIMSDNQSSLHAEDGTAIDVEESKAGDGPEQHADTITRQGAAKDFGISFHAEAEMAIVDNLDESNSESLQVGTPDIMGDIEPGQQQPTDVKEGAASLTDATEHGGGGSGDKSTAPNSKKVTEREVKARAMQEMLERRKGAASGTRSGKANPLTEAQVRAENLRAYKAGLQKSKKEKEDEERKRIEGLKNQRKERIAARNSPVGDSSTSTKKALQTPLVSRSSPTAITHKLSSSSPRSLLTPPACALSPTASKGKASNGNKIPRTPTGTTKASENPLCRSVPLLTELKKESSKVTTLTVRSSTGTQRMSQLKKNLKDGDSVLSPKASNGHTEEKKRFSPSATGRKGIPPVKDDTKGDDTITSAKPMKSSPATIKKQKKMVKTSTTQKEPVMGVAEAVAATEKVDGATDKDVHQTEEAGMDIEDISVFVMTDTGVKSGSSCVEEKQIDYAQISGPLSNEPEDAAHPSDEGQQELLPLEEGLSLVEGSKEAFNENSTTMAGNLQAEADDGTDVVGNYQAPIAHVSPQDDNAANCIASNVPTEPMDAPTEPMDTTLLEQQFNLPCALATQSPLHTPSKTLPRLHEAIQQAHSPEAHPELNKCRKKGGEASIQKASKDHHGKGLKRLLLLGRKSDRSSTRNTGDSNTVSLMSEIDEDGQVGAGSIVSMEGVGARAGKARTDTNSSSKGSRSFFSLSTFRARSEAARS